MLPQQHPAAGPARDVRLVLVNPPPLVGRTDDRSLSGGIGVSRPLKPWERTPLEVPAIDILYLAGAAEQAGARVSLVDLLLERLGGERAVAHCVRHIATYQTKHTWVGVRLSMPSLEQDLRFADKLKAALPDCTVFVFGTVIMATLDHWVGQTHVDYVLYGEPEVCIDKLLVADDPSDVAGVIDPQRYVPLKGDDLYDEAKVKARHEHWLRASELAQLPRPAWHLVDLPRYAPGGNVRELGVFVQASRGCPIGCNMCPYTMLEGDAWRHNDVLRVVSEIEYLNRTFGIHRVRFRDANFGFQRKYARALAEALIERKVKLSASIESSVEVYDEATLRLLRQAGINTITTGVETNDPECMQSIGQHFQVNDKLRSRIALCHELGFHVYGTYCLGTPEETWDSVQRTFRFAQELDIESGFTVMTPFPGTPMYFRALREGLLDKRMQFSRWNSYRSTMRSYALTTTDLDIARWWARTETILPYRKKRALAAGRLETARFYGRHLPHYALRSACRGYVAWRRRLQQSPTSHSAPVLQNHWVGKAAMKVGALLPAKARDNLKKLRENEAYSTLLAPRVLLNYSRYGREIAKRPIVMHSKPSHVEIELTNRCNLACIQCLRSEGVKAYQLGDIEVEDYKRILAQFPHILGLCLNGFGEPLMHPRFFDILAYTRRTLPWTKITIYSNGMLLDQEIARRLPGSGLSEINVSIDAATPETYKRVRRGGRLEVVHDNIRGLVQARRKQGKSLPLVGVNFVMLNENEGELVRFVEQAKELGVDFINCITYATYDWGFLNRRSKQSYRDELALAKARLEALGVVCRTFPTDNWSWTDPNRPFTCDFFWGRSLRVTYDGHVTLGCCTPFKEMYSYGNLLETPFEELWNGPGFRENRCKANAHVAPHETCVACMKQAGEFFAAREPELLKLSPRARARRAEASIKH